MGWVLLVEDDRLVAASLERIFRRRAGLRTRWAPDGEAVLRALREEPEPPRALVLDHDLGPGRPTGVDVLQVLRSRLPPGTPCAFHTGMEAAEMHRTLEAHRVEGVRLFAKPHALEPMVRWLAAVGP
ncbi:MAG: response regulator [Myxococcota bacterium]